MTLKTRLFFKGLGGFLILLSLISAPARGQQFDYAHYPDLDFSFEHMSLEIRLDPGESSLKGRAIFRVSANIEGADTLVLEAAHMEIDHIRTGETDIDYSLHNDSLFVPLPASENSGQEYQVEIQYSTDPRFGLLENSEGTLWTSMLPRTARHLFPTVDHPRIAFSTDISIIVPSGLEVVATGVRREEEILSVDRVRHRFTADRPVPATAVSFAVGEFELTGIQFDNKEITTAIENGLAGDSTGVHLLEQAQNILENVEDELGMEYPYKHLSIVQVGDHMWERKTWGASMVFLYNNRGSLVNQLKRGIFAQFFGVYQREEQWSNSLGIQMYQAALHSRGNSVPALLRTTDEPGGGDTFPYSVYNVESWNRWQQVYPSVGQAPWKQVVDRTLGEVLKKGSGAYTFSEYASYWYRDSGQPLFNFVRPDLMIAEDTARQADSVVYRVEYRFMEGDSTLKLRFQARTGLVRELVTLPLVEYLPSGTQTSEVTFTGMSDSVMVRVSPFARTIDINPESRKNLYLEQVKPARFLIYELRNSENQDERVEAAEKLSNHADNPDLQLAIMDFLKSDPQPAVKAALLRSLTEITRGATGTQDLFLDALGSEHLPVRLAGLEAMKYYGKEDAIRQSVESFATQTDSIPVFKKAADILVGVSAPEQFDAFVNTMIRTDTAGVRAIYSIKNQADIGATERAIANASSYLNPVFNYTVRSVALRILTDHDHSPANWQERIQGLLEDRDPRIRYLAVRAIGNVPGLDAASILETVIQDEYDARVYRVMRSVIGNSNAQNSKSK